MSYREEYLRRVEPKVEKPKEKEVKKEEQLPKKKEVKETVFKSNTPKK